MIPELRSLEGKYEILRKLREGGMGAIYLVRHRLLEELRVVKVMRTQLRADGDLRERFLREAKVAIQLRHPNIAQLYDFALEDDGSGGYMVLEYVDGRNLQELIAEGALAGLPLKLRIARQALAGLGFLHRRGFVHRDVSPDNIMVTRDPEGAPLVKLIDLGIVKVLDPQQGDARTGTQVFLGKIRYASPEQFESSRIDARSDLYSFGILLYELLTGVFPVRGDDMHSLISGHLFKLPVPFEESDPQGEVPEALRRIVLKAMAKSPAGRYQSAEELDRALAGIEVPGSGRVLVALPAAEPWSAPAPTELESDQGRLDRRFALDDPTPEPEPLPVARPTDRTQLRVPAQGARARRLRAGMLGVGAALLAAAIFLTVLWRAREPAATGGRASGTEGGPTPTAAAVVAAPPEPPPPSPAVAPAWLALDAAPWGEIVGLTGDDGAAVAAELPAVTPLRLRLAPGGYRVTIRDPRTGQVRAERVELEAAGTRFRARLPPIQAEDYFRALGVAP